MTEIKILPGKHKCGKDFDMRIVDVKNDNKKIVAWIIHGFCKKCNVVIVSNLHLKPEQPVLDRDFMVDYDMVSDEVESSKNKIKCGGRDLNSSCLTFCLSSPSYPLRNRISSPTCV